jgi:3-hydroxybutyryl-CoA dehydratase
MNILGGYDIEDFVLGMSATFSKTITEADIVLFAGVSGDNNAIHINAEFAESTPFKSRIAHGMLTASVISAAVANKLPGPGAIYMNQSLNFRAPVRPGDTVHATVVVKEIITGKKRVVLSTTCSVKGVLVIDGEAMVKVGSSVENALREANALREEDAAIAVLIRA